MIGVISILAGRQSEDEIADAFPEYCPLVDCSTEIELGGGRTRDVASEIAFDRAALPA